MLSHSEIISSSTGFGILWGHGLYLFFSSVIQWLTIGICTVNKYISGLRAHQSTVLMPEMFVERKSHVNVIKE